MIVCGSDQWFFWYPIGFTQNVMEEHFGRKTFLKLLILIILSIAVCRSSNIMKPADNHFFKISELCSKSFKKPNSRMIEGAVLTSLGEQNLDCVFTFQTDTILQRFMLRFERLQLDCNDHLIIYDGAYTTSPYKADLSCRNTLQNVGTIYTHSNHVTLKYVTDKWGPATNGFRLLITAFKDKQNTCLHFRCQKTNFCIDRELTCDGVNHCGDGSDESPSLALCPTAPLEDILGVSRTLLVVGIASMAALCCVCSVLVVACICRRTHANRRRHLHQDHPEYQLDVNTNYGTNGMFGSMISEKPPEYPGPQHTFVLPPGSSPGNPARPASGVGCNTQRPPSPPTGHCGRQVG